VAANGYKLDTAQIDQETYGDIQEVGDIFKFITENSVLMTAEFDAALESLHPETESDDDSHQGITVSF
jgi:ABC-type enterochelin transport system substrate-binding protein